MRIRGVDFTSQPESHRPQIAAEALLDGDRLYLQRLRELKSWERFEDWLAEPGPWIAGFDFPFGQSRRLLEGLRWSLADWPALVQRVGTMGRDEWLALLERYRSTRLPGDKEHFRATDRAAGAGAAMKARNPPLAAMFYEGVRRLERSGISVLPCQPVTGEDRWALEAYPAMVARTVLRAAGFTSTSYKGGQSATARRHQRRRHTLVAALGSPKITRPYGIRLTVPRHLFHQMEHDGTGDRLDAVMASLQAAWAWRRRGQDFGIPEDVDPLEGWIVDPGTAEPDQ